MARSIWNGVVSFGMVSIPVKLFSGTTEKDVSFNQLHDECKSRIKYVKWCPVHERELAPDEIVKGYEYGKGRYVLVEEEDFEKLPVPSKHTVDVRRFVKLEEVDPVYFDKSYYLEPDDAGVKPFSLFMKALTEKDMIAIGKIAIRHKEQLCALRPVGGTLVLETLHYADEVKVETEKPLPDMEVSEQEMSMATTLIDLLAGPFKPEEFEDEYRKAIMAMIEAKVSGEELVEAPAAPEAKITDLMEALRASVEAAEKEKAAG